MHSLPLFVRVTGEPVILLGAGDMADAKRRLIERAGGLPVDEGSADATRARIAFIAVADEAVATQAAGRLKARGLLVNVADRPHLCDFTTPAIVDRDPVLIAISTGGASAGLAGALRQRLEGMFPAHLGQLASALKNARAAMRSVWPDGGERRRALGKALAPGGLLDPFASPAVDKWLESRGAPTQSARHDIQLRSDDPDDLTVRDARALGMADRVYYPAGTAQAILARARADAAQLVLPHHMVPPDAPGLTVRILTTER